MIKAVLHRLRLGTRFTESWVCPRAGLGMCGKSAPPGFNSWTIHPVASRYTDYAILTHMKLGPEMNCKMNVDENLLI